jgi:hypothetical protein
LRGFNWTSFFDFLRLYVHTDKSACSKSKYLKCVLILIGFSFTVLLFLKQRPYLLFVLGRQPNRFATALRLSEQKQFDRSIHVPVHETVFGNNIVLVLRMRPQPDELHQHCYSEDLSLQVIRPRTLGRRPQPGNKHQNSQPPGSISVECGTEHQEPSPIYFPALYPLN